jgi:hypothetical protein
MAGTLQLTNSSKTFFANLPGKIVLGDSNAEQLLLREYGSVFVARGGAIPPDRIVFRDSDEVNRFQARLQIVVDAIGEFQIELQKPAMDALRSAMAAAASTGRSISPRGADSSRRGYEQTVELWKSRVEPGLDHWLGLGAIGLETVNRILALPPSEQVAEVLDLESQEIWFAKDLTKSIIYSVAPPGTSQHLSLLAYDVKEFADADVRAILADHGWFRTVTSDLPHFTFLGVTEEELPGLGLKKVDCEGDLFWVPDI